MRTSLHKIKAFGELAELVSRAKREGQRIAQCHGVFDVLHPGLTRHLEAARRAADLLVVTIVPDGAPELGIQRPRFNQRLRAESVSALQVVDHVAVCDGASAAEAILKLVPDVYVTGSEYGRPKVELSRLWLEEEAAVRSVGGRTHVQKESDHIPLEQLNGYFPVLSSEAQKYMGVFRKKHTLDDVLAAVRNLADLRVLVVGDVIIDEYHYCKAMGKSSKSPTLTARHISDERQAGGILAVANHVAGFVRSVDLFTFDGDSEEDREFVLGHLKQNVHPRMPRRAGWRMAIKRRFVDPFQTAKMFELMWIDDTPPPERTEDELLKPMGVAVGQVDLVIAADFGHGCIGPRTVRWLSDKAPFLAVTVQTNSANFGFNLLTKYPRSDYFCVDEEEMRLATSDRASALRSLVGTMAGRQGCKVACVTQGARGSLVWSAEGGYVSTPVFSSSVVDTTGAGDAFLSVTSLLACQGNDPEMIGFVGNCAGCLAANVVGNRESIDPEKLLGYVGNLY